MELDGELPAGALVLSGQWFEFVDMSGLGYAQTDYLLVLASHVVCMECKLTQTQGAFLQMAQLYSPLIQHLWGLPVTTLQVCKNLRYEPEVLVDLTELLHQPQSGNFTWHNLGLS